jgi:hypothetical protein
MNENILSRAVYENISWYFFSGRVLNRFSKDMGAVDEQLPKAMLETIQVQNYSPFPVRVSQIYRLYLILYNLLCN